MSLWIVVLWIVRLGVRLGIVAGVIAGGLALAGWDLGLVRVGPVGLVAFVIGAWIALLIDRSLTKSIEQYRKEARR